MFKKIRAGWHLTKESWGVLKGSPGLIYFPIVAILVGLIVAVVTLVPGVVLIAANETVPVVAGVVLVVLGIVAVAFVATFFAVGLAHNADRVLAGESPGFGEGVSLALDRSGPVLGWALISTTVGTLIQALQDRFGLAGLILGGLAGAAWAVLTFLAVPVIAIEGAGGFSAIKRCTQLIRDRWGEQITGTVAIGGIIFLIGYLPSLLIIAAGVVLWVSAGVAAAGAVLIVLGLVMLGVFALVNQAMTTIFGVVLYRYVAEGRAVGSFSEQDLADAVMTRGGMPPGIAGTTV